jgi:hypothetical protein
MYYFIVMVSGPRDKIQLIKLIRFMTGGRGLKYCKDMVEAAIDFEAWMDDYVTFEIRCDADLLANLVAYMHDDGRRGMWSITDCTRTDRLRVDMDLTANIAV